LDALRHHAGWRKGGAKDPCTEIYAIASDPACVLKLAGFCGDVSKHVLVRAATQPPAELVTAVWEGCFTDGTGALKNADEMEAIYLQVPFRSMHQGCIIRL
jgi:hypothetical protein